MCKICGTEQASFRTRSALFLCDYCHKTTPRKVNRETFERIYWEGGAATIPRHIRNEFWSDYKMSTHGSVASYQKATSAE